MSFGEQLAKARKSADDVKMSQEDLAEKVGYYSWTHCSH